MEDKGKKDHSKVLLFFLILVCIGGLLFFFSLRLSQKNLESDKSINLVNADNQNNNQSQAAAENSNVTTDQTVTSAGADKTSDNFFEQGLEYFNNKNYQAAIDEFTKAIEVNKNDPNIFSKKSQAEKNLGKQKEAIATLEDGLRYNPDSDLLKTRLDILQKQWLGSQQQ